MIGLESFLYRQLRAKRAKFNACVKLLLETNFSLQFIYELMFKLSNCYNNNVRFVVYGVRRDEFQQNYTNDADDTPFYWTDATISLLMNYFCASNDVGYNFEFLENGVESIIYAVAVVIEEFVK
ncbi:Hypothetical_protein [Hexamita inflata]|uniref:Hypothetical_protein n=1 Tax=Hexamita inflata TaxID=28002 RepID=A0ABP1HJ59_9EUKA